MSMKEKYIDNKAIMYVFKQVIYALFVVCVLITIFNFSNEVADKSSGTSARVIEGTIKLVEPKITQEKLNMKIEILQPIFRKCAHFTLYAILGFFTYNFVRTIKGNNTKNNENTTKIYLIASQVFCTTYSLTDEIHQMFIPGRSCELRDILIDSIGSFVGILICIVFLRLVNTIVQKLKNKTKNKNKMKFG